MQILARYALIVSLLALSTLVSCASSPLQNVEGFAIVDTANGDPAFLGIVRGDVQRGLIWYGAAGDAGLRDTATKFRFTAPIKGSLRIGQVRYWDKEQGVDETLEVGALLPDWVRELVTPYEIEHFHLTFQGDVSTP